MNPIIWLAGLALVFIIYDEGQRLRRRVKALEERLDHLEGRAPAATREIRSPFGRREDSGEGRFPS